MPITVNEQKKTIHLETDHTSYMMAVSEYGHLGHLYYGKRIKHVNPAEHFRFFEVPSPRPDLKREKARMLAIFPFEYPTGGIGDFRTPALQVRNEKGMSACELLYRDARVEFGKPKLPGLPSSFGDEQSVETLTVELEDPVLHLRVTLFYSVFAKEDVITRSVRICNEGKETLTIERALSASMDLENRNFEVLGLFGDWARERHPERVKLHHGKQVISSLRGVSSPQEAPFIALLGEGTSQEGGEVTAMNFVYSGNFAAFAERSASESVRLGMGIHPEGFSWQLLPGAEFVTPEVVMTYSSEGLDEMTHHFHDFYRNHLIRSRYLQEERPVLINNWEGTYFDFDETKLYEIARGASACGIEMFVMDDGWFGNRNDDEHGLGDWMVNEQKLKGGIRQLADRIRGLGMKFGIWVEPEMVNPDSDLYREHPDWAIAIPGREPSLFRSQLVLDISRKEVRDEIMDRILKVLHEVEADYVKWDMNRYLSDLGSFALTQERQGELSHRYVLGVYEMQERLVKELPNLLFENCSSGGARFDPGMLYYSPQIWTSDDTDAIERLKIQEGTALVYPLSTMGAHVSKVPNEQVGRICPIATRANVALAGSFGYELDITKMTAEEKEEIPKQIRMYHRFRKLTMEGDYYRIASWSAERPFDVWMIVSKDRKEALVTYVQVLGRPQTGAERIRLRGLDPDTGYHMETVSGKMLPSTSSLRYGDDLMNDGMLFPALGDFESLVLYLRAERAGV